MPLEGATHIHFDATPLLSAAVIARLVETLWRFGDGFKALLGANPNCVRLGRWPEALPALTRGAAFQAMPWPKARAALNDIGLTKYCDFNLLNVATLNQDKHTFEVRILPVWLEPEPLLEAAALFEAFLTWCLTPPPAMPDTLAALIAQLPLPQDVARVWTTRAERSVVIAPPLA